MTIVGYARVSSSGQSLDIQLDKLKAAGCTRIYEEKASGKTSSTRPQFKACMEYLREGDHLVISKLDRLARSVLDLSRIADRFDREGISLVVLDQNIDTSTSGGRLLFNMLGAIAEFENELRRERQLEGINRAKERNVKFGRAPSLNEHQELNLVADRLGGMPMSALTRKYKIGVATAYRIMAKHAPNDSVENIED